MAAKIEQIIEREKLNVRSQIEALQRLKTERFTAGDRVLIGTDPLPALITAGLDPTHPQRHFVWLGGSPHPPPLAQDLACGVLSEGGQLVAATRTNGTGHVAVDLAQGTYSLRPVTEVREPIDVEILIAIGDETAYGQLEAALAGSAISESVRAAADHALQQRREAPATRKPAPAGPIDVHRVAPEWAVAMDDQGPSRTRESHRGWWIDPDAYRLCFRYPAAAADFPFSAVLVELREHDVVLASRLMPVSLAGSVYANSIGLDELLGDRAYEPSMRDVVWADANEILQRVSLEEVDRVLDSHYVTTRPEVKKGLTTLRRMLTERLDSDRLAREE